MQFEETQSRIVNRTVCIGLGGTGRDILMRIRRLIVDRYGDFKQLPVISFVHIDTDKGASNTTGLKTGNTYHGVDLRFSDVEKVSATITRSQVQNLVKELTKRKNNYDGSSGAYSNIGSWFPPQLLKDLKAIDEGAQAIRPVGRLAFFHNYRSVKNAIESAERKTRGHESFMIRQNWSVDNRLNIFLVGSLCGGTGSGTFLDVAYCLRQMYGNDDAQIVGYFIISPELYGNAPDKNANVYAALKELNYYATAGTTFNAEYDLQNLDSVAESRPPFEYVYLISNRTAKDYKILEKSKLCNIIAHKITLDIAGELAAKLRSDRDNYLKFMIQTDEHPRPNTQRYLTFGLAEIYFPRDVAVQVSLNRIKIKLVDFWLHGEGQSADANNLLVSFLDRWYDIQSNNNGFITKLQQATTDGSKTFSNALSSWRNRLESNITEIQNNDERQEVVSQLGREIRSEFRKVQPGETESSRGLWFTNLQQQCDRLIAEYLQDIDTYLTQLLNPNHLNFSLANTRIWLEALTTELNKSYRVLEDKISGMKATHSIETVDRKWQDSQQIIEDIENKKGLPFFNKQKTIQIQEEAKRIVGQVSKLIQDNYELALFREALTIVKTLQSHVSELSNQCSSFSNLLNNIKLTYEKTENELKLQDIDDMSGEAIFADTDTDECYSNLLPDRDRNAQLALVSSKITERVGLEESLASCLERGVVDEQNLQEQIDLVVDGDFGSRSLSTVQSAVKRFLESYPLNDRATRLEQIIRESEPLLPLNIADPYFYDDPSKTIKIVGFKDTDKPEISQFKNILFKDIGILDSDLTPIQAEEEIILVQQYGAFPLRLIRDLEKMQQHYNRQKNYGKGFLHNDYRIPFIDIIPPDAIEIENLQDIFYPSLAFELLPYNSNLKQYEFQYFDNFRNRQETIYLSYVWDEALEQLTSRKDMVDALDGRLNDAIADLTRNPQRWNEYYLPKLQQFIAKIDDLPEGNPNYFYKEIVIGSPATIDRRQQDGIINRFWNRMRNVVEAEMNKQKQQQEQKILTDNTANNNLLTGNNLNNNINDSSPQNITNSSVIEAKLYNSNTNNRVELETSEIERKLVKLRQLKAQGRISEENFFLKEKELLDLYL